MTSREVAEKAGVSRTTVSLVLNGRGGSSIPDETRRRVREVASHLGYRPHSAARALARGRADVFGIVLNEEPSHERASQFFQRTLLDALLYAVLKSGRNPMLYLNLPDAPEDLHSYADGRADAFLLITPRENDPLMAYLSSKRIPCVALGRRCSAAFGSWVDADHEVGAAAAVRLLAEAGHTRIAHLSGPADNPTARARLEGYRTEMAVRGLTVPDAYIRDGSFVARRGEEATAALLSLPEPPTALFCGNDQMALGAYRAARGLGLSLPEDLSVVGFDDADYAAGMDPSLSTVRYPLFRAADAAVELLTSLLVHPQRGHSPRTLPTELIARGSVAPPPAHGKHRRATIQRRKTV